MFNIIPSHSSVGERISKSLKYKQVGFPTEEEGTSYLLWPWTTDSARKHGAAFLQPGELKVYKMGKSVRTVFNISQALTKRENFSASCQNFSSFTKQGKYLSTVFDIFQALQNGKIFWHPSPRIALSVHFLQNLTR